MSSRSKCRVSNATRNARPFVIATKNGLTILSNAKIAACSSLRPNKIASSSSILTTDQLSSKYGDFGSLPRALMTSWPRNSISERNKSLALFVSFAAHGTLGGFQAVITCKVTRLFSAYSIAGILRLPTSTDMSVGRYSIIAGLRTLLFTKPRNSRN